MTLKQKIIFSSTLVAIIAGLAGWMTYKNSQPLQGVYREAVAGWKEEGKAVEQIKFSFLELQEKIIKGISSPTSGIKEVYPSIEEESQAFYSQVQDLQTKIESYGEIGDRQNNLKKALLQEIHPIINIGESIRYPFSGSSGKIKKSLARLEAIEGNLFAMLDRSLEVGFEETQMEGQGVVDGVNSILKRVVIASFLVFLLAIIFGQLIAWDLSKAIDSLKLAASQLEKGNYSTKLPLNRKDEFGVLAGTFNQVAEDLQKTIIIEEQNEQLEELNLELKRKNDSLDSFVYRVSHDLKAPVVNLKSLLKVVIKEVKETDNEVLNKTMFFMEKTSEKLQQTIVDLLEVSRIERNLETVKTQVDLREVLEEVIVENSDIIEKKEANVFHDFDTASTVYFSFANTKSILANILTNSLKYSSPDRSPQIEVKSAASKDYITLSITDNGIGIDLERHQKKLFGMFNRFHNHVEGSGVGLYIVKKLIDESGGKLEIESEVNKGTTIKLFFLRQKNKKKVNELAEVV